MRITMPLVALLVCAAPAPAQDDADTRPAEPAPPSLAPGWRWVLEPFEPPESWPAWGTSRFAGDDGMVTLYAGKAGNVVLQHVRQRDPELRGSAVPEYAPHLLDAAGERLARGMTMSMARKTTSATFYRFGRDVRPDDVARVGLAVLDLEGRRVAAAAARKRAREVGASVLPLPVVGEPFPFDLPTLGGERVSSEDLVGKVVLIDCWATW